MDSPNDQTVDLTSFVNFGDVARGRLNQQCQYAPRYVGGLGSVPDLSEGLRFVGDNRDYHSLMIHQDDVDEFVARVLAYRAGREARDLRPSSPFAGLLSDEERLAAFARAVGWT